MVQTVLFPLTMDGERLGIRSDPPRMGEHTEALLQSLGYCADRIDALRASGCIA